MPLHLPARLNLARGDGDLSRDGNLGLSKAKRWGAALAKTRGGRGQDGPGHRSHRESVGGGEIRVKDTAFGKLNEGRRQRATAGLG